MSQEPDNAQLTSVSPLETEVGPHPSGRRHAGGPDDGRVRGSSHDPAIAGTDERLKIGERLSGRYRIERELGEGGMGVVFLATDEQVAGEMFAIKVLKAGLDPQALELLRE